VILSSDARGMMMMMVVAAMVMIRLGKRRCREECDETK
jgi:hypothetical protein